jgi:hypothetical protein
MFLQQGDVLIFKIEKLPAGLKLLKKDERGFTLAHGESGHAHVIADEDTVFVSEDGTLYVQASAPVTLHHEEHKAITIDPGLYRVGRVQEVDPFTKEISSVRD